MAPHGSSLAEFDLIQIESNPIWLYKEIIQSFLRNARDILCGEVHLTTHKKGYPFGDWKINQKLGKEVTMKLVAKVPFSMADYPGYINRRGGDNNDTRNDTFPIGECSTFKFVNLLIYNSQKRTKREFDSDMYP
ncbi:hypothetical protein RD792_005394 [Penstemon davidsonii]|uniref:25S rRNA (uridine-N(3))-methyltransferase BMT5-like domain-containing protein n=1 Tax=Penstemon davidsonii TaxID=160366 RepID=A0ABR0DK35_9LAMI|nr:hypothetical protein RD792_005394 [Penstemon davidsonii]